MKSNSKSILLLAILIAGSAIFYWINRSEDTTQEIQENIETQAESPTPEQIQSTEIRTPLLFGEKLLLGYGQGDPTTDLQKIEAVISNYRLLAKGMDARHFSSNSELAATLRGEKKISLSALPVNHSVFDEDGLIIDRWDTPIFFHMETADNLSMYSAGPDKELGTDDDYLLVDGIAKQSKAEF